MSPAPPSVPVGIRGLAELYEQIALAPHVNGVSVVAFVGAGGKTSAMFALARSFAGEGKRVLVTTTTRIFHPGARSEREGRGFGTVITLDGQSSPDAIDRVLSAGPRVVLGLTDGDDSGKLAGVAPELLSACMADFDVILIEADGSRGLPLKAPAAHEPVIPAFCGAVVGTIGLDAPGSAMDGQTVHRSEIFGALVACAEGEAISFGHLAKLASARGGLFKGSPRGARRIVLLNKSDTVTPEFAEGCASVIAASGSVDGVVIAAFGENSDTRGGEA
ncbi:MAG: selenium cofactor biosynthesis protein YqeC [Rectinemataceae bacterium]